MPASRIQYSKTEDIDVWWIFVLGSPREGDALAGHVRGNGMQTFYFRLQLPTTTERTERQGQRLRIRLASLASSITRSVGELCNALSRHDLRRLCR
jgi:hypothetical protein